MPYSWYWRCCILFQCLPVFAILSKGSSQAVVIIALRCIFSHFGPCSKTTWQQSIGFNSWCLNISKRMGRKKKKKKKKSRVWYSLETTTSYVSVARRLSASGRTLAAPQITSLFTAPPQFAPRLATLPPPCYMYLLLCPCLPHNGSLRIFYTSLPCPPIWHLCTHPSVSVSVHILAHIMYVY